MARSKSTKEKPKPNKGAPTMSKHGSSTSTDDKTMATPRDKKKKHGWNTMSHLYLKRFANNDSTLTAGARRDRIKHPHVAVAELDPSGRAVCKKCGDRIPKGTVRLCLWLECHKGYRNLCTLHPTCFWQHPETKKLKCVEEIMLDKKLNQLQMDEIQEQFKRFVEKLPEEKIAS